MVQPNRDRRVHQTNQNQLNQRQHDDNIQDDDQIQFDQSQAEILRLIQLQSQTGMFSTLDRVYEIYHMDNLLRQQRQMQLTNINTDDIDTEDEDDDEDDDYEDDDNEFNLDNLPEIYPIPLVRRNAELSIRNNM